MTGASKIQEYCNFDSDCQVYYNVYFACHFVAEISCQTYGVIADLLVIHRSWS